MKKIFYDFHLEKKPPYAFNAELMHESQGIADG